MRVLVARKRESSRAIAERLTQLGHEGLYAPMLIIDSVKTESALPPNTQAVLVTSANAIRHMPSECRVPSLRVLAVGDATAQAAREAGFRNVDSAQGAARDLEVFARSRLIPAEGSLLYLRGHDVRANLAEDLASAGFVVEERVVYRAVPVQCLPAGVAANIENGRINVALLLSRRSAEVFAGFITPSLGKGLANIRALTLAPSVAEPLAGLGFGSVECAGQPNIDSLLAMLKESED